MRASWACVVAASLTIGVLSAACSAGAPKNAPPPASEEAAPRASEATATPDADTIEGIPVRRFTVGPPVPFPDGYVFYEVQWQWEGPAKAVQRAYRGPGGVVRLDMLYETRLTGTPPDGPAISSVAASANGASIAIGLCGGFCYGETGSITVVSSSDTGITWEELARVNPTGWVRGAGRRSALVQTPGELIVVPTPGGTEPVISGQASVLLMVADPLPAVLLRATDGITLTGPDGTVFARTPLPAGSRIEAIQPAPLGAAGLDGAVLLDWSVPKPPDRPSAIEYSAFVDGPGGRLRAIFEWDPELWASPSAGIWLDANREVRMLNFPATVFGDRFAVHGRESITLPAIVDYRTATVSPIIEHFADAITGPKSGSPAVLAVAKGPFARVKTGADCLNVRGTASTAAPSLGCYRDGVLLKLRDEPERKHGGLTWLPVTTPDGRPGWASAEFLER